ncbi:MAG: glycoside hydrolase family 38 C-terminal domain-containing protein, partial [Lentisphaeria bacterium]
MSLNPEWRRRVDHWRNTMKKMFFRPADEVRLEGFFTFDLLTPAAAEKGKFKPMPTGTKWGAKWEYGWFRTDITVPAKFKGESVVLQFLVGNKEQHFTYPECVVYVNGQAAGSKGWADRPIFLTRKAKGGERFHILVEAYAGHGVMECGGGPCPDGQTMVPEPPATQAEVGASCIGIWEEELYQLWFDMETLFRLRETMADQNALRVSEIDGGLKDVTCLVDLELPRAEMLKTVRAGRRRLQPLLACTNGSTSPLLTCFGHSHIDIAWLWPVAETERKVARTFSNQLSLMEMYPEYKFLQSQAHLYRMTKQLHPEIYERIRKAIKSGQWIVDGAMWVEADTNLAGGESLIRQFLHGKRFFKEEFGINNEMMWLPDVFGYSGALPQLMAGCGIKYFSTQKIFWTYNGGDPFPQNTFWWEGIDGTRVLAHIHNDYNSETTPTMLVQRWNERVQKDGINARLVPFGWGDGGGGPTREHLEFLRREANLEGMPRTRIGTPAEFFHDLERQGTDDLPAYLGELYFQAHRGTYTTQAAIKKGNRQCELALRDAELWGAAAGALAGFAYPLADADLLWKDVLLNQFHDIIPGSSIARVYAEARALYAKVRDGADAIAGQARAKLAAKAAGKLTVFNSISWNRDALVALPAGSQAASDADGRPLPTQTAGKTTYALLRDVPPCGWTTLQLAAKPGKAAPVAGAVKATAKSLENELLKVTVNGAGEITSVIEKSSGRELAAGPCNQLRLYKDVPGAFDAWDLDSQYKLTPAEMDGKVEVKLAAAGPLFGALRVKRTFGASSLEQEIVLRAGSRRLEFRTRVSWQERHKILKACFPVTLRAENALHEIQFGHLRRPTHGSRPFDADRFEVCNNKWTALTEEGRGAAVLNDCKYGISVEDNSINLTLLRAPLAPDATADQGEHEFTYALLCWDGAFKDSGILREAYDLNIPVTTAPGAPAAAAASL